MQSRTKKAPEVVDKLANALQGGQVQVEDGVVVFGDAGLLGSPLRLQEIAAGHHDMPLACTARVNSEYFLLSEAEL